MSKPMADTVEQKVRGYYPQAFAAKDSRFWRVYRDPSEPLAKCWLGGAVTRRGAWEKALKNIAKGPQCGR